MDKNRKTSYLLLGGLVLATVAARAAYHPSSIGWMPPPDIRLPASSAPKVGWEPVGHLPPGAPGGVRLKAELDRSAVLQNADNELHVSVTVDTHGLGSGAHVPTDFIVVFDHSGSMSGQKIEYGKHALRELIRRLGDRDRFSLVAYDSSADVRVPLGEEAHVARQSWLRAVEGLSAASGTNISSGLDLGLSELNERRQNAHAARILLLSDGLANEGDATLEGLELRARRTMNAGSVLSTIGIGGDFDEKVMSSLARTGAGAFYYLAKLETLPQLLNAELQTAGETYAEKAELLVKVGPGVQLLSASGRAFSTEGDTAIVPVGSLYADHAQELWLTLKVPNGTLEPRALGSLSVRYRRDAKPFETAIAELPKVEVVADAASFERGIVQSVWERAVVEEEIAKSREQLGSAIREGGAEDVDKAIAAANTVRPLAEKLGNRNVLARLDEVSALAAPAKAAQSAGGEAQLAAAKQEASIGFSARSRTSYKNVDPALSH